MADDADRAQDLEERLRSRGIAATTFHETAISATTHCVDCGDPIPEARRQALPRATRCISCQETAEGSGRCS